MRLDKLVSDIAARMFGRLLRRAAAVLLLALFVLIIIYELTAAGTLALADHYGMVHARLIIAGIFALCAAVTVGVLVATRAKPDTKAEKLARQPQAVGIAMLIESVLLGYSLARGKPRPNLKRT